MSVITRETTVLNQVFALETYIVTDKVTNTKRIFNFYLFIYLPKSGILTFHHISVITQLEANTCSLRQAREKACDQARLVLVWLLIG